MKRDSRINYVGEPVAFPSSLCCIDFFPKLKREVFDEEGVKGCRVTYRRKVEGLDINTLMGTVREGVQSVDLPVVHDRDYGNYV